MFESKMFCDGAKYNEVSTNLFCDVPVQAVLRQQPFLLSFDQLVVAQVQA